MKLATVFCRVVVVEPVSMRLNCLHHNHGPPSADIAVTIYATNIPDNGTLSEPHYHR